jgi:MOSC domain-containing protein YiiM
LGILTSDSLLVRQLGLPMRARFSTRNGGIPVDYLVTERGSARDSAPTPSNRANKWNMSGRVLDKNITGRVASLNISSGGVPKKPVAAALVTRLRLEGDAQNDKKGHGGPERAVCLYSLEVITALQAEGHPIGIGTAGENVTVQGIDWREVSPGVHIRIGKTVLLQVASYTVPCKTIKGSFLDGKFTRISQQTNPGWSRVYARVLIEGEIHEADSVELNPSGQ